MNPIKLESKQDFKTLINGLPNKAILVIDFYADWCGPCRVVAPLVRSVVAAAMKSGTSVYLAAVDTDQATDDVAGDKSPAAGQAVTALPTVVVGRVVDDKFVITSRLVGSMAPGPYRTELQRMLDAASTADGIE